MTTSSYELIREFMWPTAKPEKEKTCMTCYHLDIMGSYCNKRAFVIYPENRNSISYAECWRCYESPPRPQPFPPKVESPTEWKGNNYYKRDVQEGDEIYDCSCGNNVRGYELRPYICMDGTKEYRCPHCLRSV